ncbi:TetR/AcrR family transcriptional regulator [Cyclobacterium marinum]|uniref:Transcriptional regulator, TetR family n=1 Tax=Cyclobacterium marinum (strain ATCC 25205 / DSM 745 / LMG 13164 / NCIMB 1802) TaxID=880070 RepID=G0IY94_CYCMS|nr:TetR/AcrR family transcriptional regulator [Cyclobacterium marinum]AEL24998.1 transcriptional regulator, TetR family [Cyclobacterium marinum DSM 745]MBI0401533.1 TetR/AcrR family transcriptional regulator [Cyclobacterium marinum]
MLQELKSERTKKLILDKAYELFYEEGFKSSSIDRIVKASHLTKGAFYHHFKSKKELGLKVIELKIQERIHQGMIVPLSNPGEALDLLRDTFFHRIKLFSLYDKKHGCPFNNLINEIGNQELAYRLALKKVLDEWKQAIIRIIERGKKEKTIKKSVSSHAVAIYLISAFEGVRGIRKLYDNDSVLTEYLLGLSFYLDHLGTN